MNSNNCIGNLLKYIYLLQSNSTSSCLKEDCTKPYLGPTISLECYNTRVISLYKKDGTLFTVQYGDNLSSSTFRIMNIYNDTVTLLVLSNSDDIYSSTNQFITVNINCICAVRCIVDTSITL